MRKVNRRRGFTRLALAFGIPYFGYWTFIGLSANAALPSYLAASDRASKAGDWNAAMRHMNMANAANGRVNESLVWGVLVPIAALIVGGLAYWVYRGFVQVAKEERPEG